VTKEIFDVPRKGDESGNHMIIRMRLSSGREIFGFATENTYGGEWDLGPTWNYVITSEKPFLVDAGRRGNGGKLLDMMQYCGFDPYELELVVLSHGHEDHDGGLFELIERTRARIVAHNTYGHLIRPYPQKAPSEEKKDFPAACWQCPMPESFWKKNCVEYHKERAGLPVDGLDGSGKNLANGVSVFHVPGHSPDSIALLIDKEVMLVGDTILPDITPHPTCEHTFKMTKAIFQGHYREADELYGLRAYIRSLKRLKGIGEEMPGLTILPGHRLFYQDRWNWIDLEIRTTELIEHHVQRCGDILKSLGDGPKQPEEIARACFEERLLKGFGITMALNEVLSHCELLEISKDVVFGVDGKISATQRTGFESLMRDLR
jgi:glyoxylase-like metal-dependent hydrolase (beta-lactamase superfamily II)